MMSFSKVRTLLAMATCAAAVGCGKPNKIPAHSNLDAELQNAQATVAAQMGKLTIPSNIVLSAEDRAVVQQHFDAGLSNANKAMSDLINQNRK